MEFSPHGSSNHTAEITRLHSRVICQNNGLAFRDLNHNGILDIYEDPRQPLEARVENLLIQMTLEEKAGILFINGSDVNDDGSLEENRAAQEMA